MKRLIHVDNSDFFRKVVDRYLENEGIIAESSKHATNALETLKEGNIGLVITGMVLADMNGDLFIKLCNIMAPDVPIIVLTSNSIEKEQKKLEGLRVEAILDKSPGWQKVMRPYLDKHFGED